MATQLSAERRRPSIDDLVASHMGLAHALARRFGHRGEPQDDLDQWALVALVAAAHRFDPEREVSFATFATVSVSGELKRYFRDRSRCVRAPRRLHDLYLQIGDARGSLAQGLGRAPTVAEIGRHLGATDEEILEAMEAGGAHRSSSLDAPYGGDGWSLLDELADDDDHYETRLNRVWLAQKLPTLPAEERLIIGRYYFEDKTQKEIAEEIGVSQMQVSRLLARSLGRLRRCS